MDPIKTPLPMPVIVGVGRSGTTLLRFMLDSHSDLAIPPETGFLPDVAALDASGGPGRASLLRSLVSSAGWADYHVEEQRILEELQAIDPFTSADGVRCFYRLYAGRFGKRRWGDKTPMYCMHLTTIARFLPEARFIHIIRDGRDVALSVRGLWFSPGKTIEDIALDWRRRILTAREQAPGCPHYTEIRYEDLVGRPRDSLRRLCGFLELTYEDDMERYYLRAPGRLQEHEDRYDADGRLIISKEQRLHNQRYTCLPPEPSRVHRWKSEMTSEERRRFEGVAGELLSALGYDV